MKAISLLQPWASLVAIGAKGFETRSWSTNYRGPLAIHASKGFPGWARDLFHTLPFSRVLAEAGYLLEDDLPCGAVIAVVRLVDCYPITMRNGVGLLCPPQGERREVSEQETAFGDWSPGRFAWRLADVRPLREPIPARGALGLWEWKAPENLEELFAS